MKLKTLFESKSFETDKGILGYIDLFYDELFEPYKDPVNLLEIGIFAGGSMRLWKEYFHPESNLYGADINQHAPAIHGVNTIYDNMYSKSAVESLQDDYFDIIIDDGPHTFESFVMLLCLYYDKLKQNGKLIVEDIIVTQWVEPLVRLAEKLGYKVKVIDATGAQKTQDLLNCWAGGLYVLELTK